MRLKYVGEGTLRYGERPLKAGEELDVPENAARSMVENGPFEFVDTVTEALDAAAEPATDLTEEVEDGSE